MHFIGYPHWTPKGNKVRVSICRYPLLITAMSSLQTHFFSCKNQQLIINNIRVLTWMDKVTPHGRLLYQTRSSGNRAVTEEQIHFQFWHLNILPTKKIEKNISQNKGNSVTYYNNDKRFKILFNQISIQNFLNYWVIIVSFSFTSGWALQKQW